MISTSQCTLPSGVLMLGLLFFQCDRISPSYVSKYKNFFLFYIFVFIVGDISVIVNIFETVLIIDRLTVFQFQS